MFAGQGPPDAPDAQTSLPAHTWTEIRYPNRLAHLVESRRIPETAHERVLSTRSAVSPQTSRLKGGIPE